MSLGVFNSAAFLTASQLAVAANATVEVRREDTGALASIFSDRAGSSAITNPSAFADASGRFTFYTAASPSGFSILVTSGAESFTLRNVPIGLGQEFDIVEFWRAVLATATKLAARIALKVMGLDGLVSRATNTILGASDSGKAFIATASFTQTLDAAATLGADWHVFYRVPQGVAITFDPDGAETIDGEATKVVTGPAAGVIAGDGSSLLTYGFDAPFTRAHMSGLTWANNAGDATNDIDIAVGECRDSTSLVNLVLASALTKRLDAAWAVGTNQGGLDTGAIGNNDYYIHLIRRPDTGVVDALFSLSATAPTMPANYTQRRLFGWFKRVAATIVPFTTYEMEGGGVELVWTTPTTDVNLASTLTTSRRTDAVKVPLNFSVVANLGVTMRDGTSGHSTLIYCPDQSDIVPVGDSALATVVTSGVAPNAGGTANVKVRTSATGTVAARSTLATVDVYAVVTFGFEWARRSPL